MVASGRWRLATELAGKVVVITGGSRGIGRGIALGFAREGAETVIAAPTPAHLEEARDAIAAATGFTPMIHAVDLRTVAGCESLHAAVARRHGRCDVLVNSAGATRAGAFLNLPDALWGDGFDLKFFGCVRLCRLFWPMLEAAKGHVINIIGGAARTPDPEFMIGGAVNAAMANFTKALAGLGKRSGVNVNAILPGLTETERVEQLFAERAAATGRTVEDVRAQQIRDSGLRRLGQPEDIAELALFLCSERARHIQGTAIAVDGGQTPGVY